MQVRNRRNEDRVAAAVEQAEAKAALAAKHAFSSRELFTLDWANTLLGATWAPALEHLLSAKLTTTLKARYRLVSHDQALFGRQVACCALYPAIVAHGHTEALTLDPHQAPCRSESQQHVLEFQPIGLHAQAALTRLVQGDADRGPLRYLERIEVDKVMLGRRAPLLSSCTASTGAPASCVRLALPFTFEPAEGFNVVVSNWNRPKLYSTVQAEQ